MSEPVSSVAVWLAYTKYALVFLIPFVEPQMAGMLGSLAYLIVRHELRMATLGIKSICIVLFFGWLGAWATVHIFAEYENVHDVWIQIGSAVVGFMSYDAMLSFGANTKSVLGFFVDIAKRIITRRVDK